MVLEVTNVSLVQFKDREIGEESIPPRMMKEIDSKDLILPVVLRCGAVDYTLGTILRTRRGREEIFGDLSLEISGSLEYEVIKNEKGETTGVKPKKFVYVKE